MKLYIGCDSAGITYKEELIKMLISQNHEVIDVPIRENFEDYPDVAKEVCDSVLNDHESKGILICGTGMGMCLAANKVKGIRATLCHDTYSAQKSRSSNDANILTMGALTMGLEQIKEVAAMWVLDYELNPSSAKKVAKITKFEESSHE